MLAFPSQLTHVQAAACLQALSAGLRAQDGAVIQLDVASLQHFDSSALAVLLDLRRQCLVLGKTLTLQGFAGRLADLAALYGVGELLAQK